MGSRNHLGPQLILILIAWLFLVSLHWRNDGLWFQGDSSRHAANGLFWKDFLLSGSLNPKDYALRYYARYPLISPTNYPPLFYIFEGTIFTAFHPSPYAAKSLVLFFALLAACYLMAWLRQWIAAEAGWAAALLLLLPGFVVWSNAVMLNVPATALSLAALYHARRWLESSSEDVTRRQLYLAAIFSISATLTYFPAGILIFVVVAWMLMLRRWMLLFNFRTVCVALAALVLLLPFIYVAFKWAPMHTAFVTNGFDSAKSVSAWIFYLKKLPVLTGPYILAMSVLGLATAAFYRKWRRECLLLLVYFAVPYLALSMIAAKESRYALLLCVPIVCFCAMAVLFFAELLSRLTANKKEVPITAVMTMLLLVYFAQAVVAATTRVPRVKGIKEVVDFLERMAPDEPVFYDGYYNNVFTFYLQAGDPRFRRRVVLGAKLLYSSALNPMNRYRAYVKSTDDIVRTLQERGGCRWLAIEIGQQSRQIPASRLLQDTVEKPQFAYVRSFAISGPGIERIDLYRFKPELNHVNEVDLPFPILGDAVTYRVRPIQR